mmetsp:Transcript_39799/g.95195  ORF Transcript_39799/g.95195 Transcript_39799/m.95195 type:complete len:458 (+) Transcript_39799:68-1441(+)
MAPGAQETKVQVFESIKARDPHQPEFLQAVEEVLDSLWPMLEKDPQLLAAFKFMAEPERVIHFRVPWTDRHGELHFNRGFRVQFSSAIGPYKGGLRFHPSVNLSVLKFLGFEQILKNSLTTLSMGGAKGGSDFDPKGRTDEEVRSFCQSFMTELYRHIGANVDVPAGDINVGGREIGYLYGQYRKLTGHNEGVLTGKGVDFGGSLIRPQATGYGVVYFLFEMADNVSKHGEEVKIPGGASVLISGSGNVAQFAAEKCIQCGLKVLTLSDSNGTLLKAGGLCKEDLDAVMHLKNVQRGRLRDVVGLLQGATYQEGARPWDVADALIALPCATQNEIGEADAERLAERGVRFVAEGANMPSTNGAVRVYAARKILYGPAKAANAGGVAVSGLEMAQNAGRLAWPGEQVDGRLKDIMRSIASTCVCTALKYGRPASDLQFGANVAGFEKVARAIIAQGFL